VKSSEDINFIYNLWPENLFCDTNSLEDCNTILLLVSNFVIELLFIFFFLMFSLRLNEKDSYPLFSRDVLIG